MAKGTSEGAEAGSSEGSSKIEVARAPPVFISRDAAQRRELRWNAAWSTVSGPWKVGSRRYNADQTRGRVHQTNEDS
jgi:hypothetical protein